MPRKPEPWWRDDRQAWFVQIRGKRHNLGPDESAAWQRYYALMANPTTEQQPRVEGDQVAAIIDAYLDWVHRERAAETYEWHRYRLQRFVDKYPGLRVCDLRPYHVTEWVGEYEFSVTSRRNYMRSIKSCLRWAKAEGYLSTNPLETMSIPAADEKEVLISPEQFQQLLDNVRNDSLRDLLVTTWETGCRPQESLRVEARHVDLENQRWVFRRSESKNRKNSRVVYLTDTAAEVTRRWMAKFPKGALFRNTAGRPWTTDAVNCALVAARVRIGKSAMLAKQEEIPVDEINGLAEAMLQNSGGRVTSTTLTRPQARQRAREKLVRGRALRLAPPFSLYALRHSWATHALERGVDPLTVAILLGHSDPSMLSKVYQHVALDPRHMLNQAKRAVG